MSPKFRLVYLFLGFIGLVCSINYIITAFTVINSATVLLVTIPVMAFFMLAYRTWPADGSEHKIVRVSNKR